MADEIESNEIKTNFNHNSAENIEAIKLINYFTLMCPIELFKKRILIKKPNELVKKRLQIAKISKEIIQRMDIEQKTSLKKAWKKKF